MSELAGYAFEKLWEDDEFALSRGGRRGGSTPVLMLVPVSERPAPETYHRLEYAYSLRHELDSAWAVRPLALVHNNERQALVLEGPDGDLLDRQPKPPMELQAFLRVAISIAVALGRLHARGFIHRSLKPANIYVDLADDQARLIALYLTPRLPLGPIPGPPELTNATLPYLAPEQTGRMNRSTDSRSDLYAFGVILYRMVTGALPFAAKDPMEWIHCHLAIQPLAPKHRVKEIPEPISAIIMKLLAKIPEDRYQTAAGVEMDLRTCLAQASGGQITAFQLGARDVPNQLVISERLYGRDLEFDTLLLTFDRVASQGTLELVLVSGYSGVGKSTLVNELQKQLGPAHGLFASGKFDQSKRDIPYTTVVQAFQTLVRQILSKSDSEVSHWKERLVEALGTNGQLLSNLLPELDLIIGKQPPVPDLPPQEAHNRFKIIFRRFIGVFARPEHPLALFLDDLQWADTGTLQLLEHLVTEPEVRHLLLIGAYRDNEVSASDALGQILEQFRGIGVAVGEIVLAPLSLRSVTQLVTDSLRCNSDRAEPLAQLIHEKSGGNPFFTIQFLKALADEDLLAFDSVAAVWKWNVGRIQMERFTDNVEDLVSDKLDRLPEATRQALKELACLGSSATTSTISIVSGKSEPALDMVFLEAIRAGLVAHLGGAIKFVHDRVQEAAYQLIPEGERAGEHLRIGRLLADRTSPAKIEESIFEVVNQLNRGVTLVTSLAERARIAELNLIAGKRARVTVAYASALKYLAVGNELLEKDCWTSNYETAFAITLNRAECELLTGQLTTAEERLSMLSTLAASHADRAAVTSLSVVLYMTLDRAERAVAVCLEYLRSAGIACPENPTKEEVAQEYERLWRQLGSRTIEELVHLPAMTDPACRGALEVLTAIVPPSWFTEQNLRNLLVARMANLSLEYGNSEASCYAYAVLARTLGSHFGDYQAGYRFGKLSLELVDQRGSDRYKTRVYTCFGHHIDPWKRHLKHGRKWLRLAAAAAPQAGDLTFVAYNCVNIVGNLLASGEPLSDVLNEAETGLEFARRMGYRLGVDFITGQLIFIRALRGFTTNLSSFDDVGFDEHEFEQHLGQDPRLAAAEFRYWVRKLQAHFHADNYGSAAEAAAKAAGLPWRSQSFFEVAEYPFYAALALAALYTSATSDERISHLDTIVAHHELLSTWARNCPENFACMEALVAAEIARIEARHLDAESLYEDSVKSAQENGFVHNEGLANELAARFYAGRGLEMIASAYLRNARYSYLRWGALGKVRQIDQKHPGLSTEPMISFPHGGIVSAADRLDSAAVAKALQAISSEIVLGKLIKTLMRIAVEHAGAERGLFLLVRNHEPQIDAEATTVDGRVEVILQTDRVTASNQQEHQGSIGHSSSDGGTSSRRSPARAGEGGTRVAPRLPLSILQYVLRTRECVILEDASGRNLFSEDDYLCQRRPKSVLCVPIVRQSEVVGILYLENNLTTHAFTSERTTVLKLLASQAAISLENARLYADLRKSEEKYRDLIDVSPDAIFIIDTDLTYVSANPAGAKLAGCTQAELVGTPIARTFVAGERPLLPARMEMMKTEPYLRFERKFVRRNGEIVPVEVSLTTVRGRYLQAVLRDISERKKAEEALRASEQVARGQVEALTYSLDVLATASEPEKFLGKMLSTICRLLTGKSATLWLFDEPSDSLTLRLVVDSESSVGFAAEHPVVQDSRSWKENPVIQELFFAAGPIVCEDIELDPRVNDQFRDYFLPKGTKKFLAVPILVGGQVRGMITVRHGERSPYRTEEVGLMQALAHQVMLAIRLTEVGEQSRQAAVLAERNRMARDVHDTLAQGFTGVIVQLEAAEYAMSEGDREDANRHLLHAGELARRSLSEARRSVHALRPHELEEANFWQALKGIVKNTTIGTTLQTTFEAKGKVPVLPPAWQENLLRIGQETLTNTLKYARARNFRCRLISNSRELRLELRDDGNGFQVEERHDGVGLRGMRERAEEMGGQLKIMGSRGKGTTITLILPLNLGAASLPPSQNDDDRQPATAAQLRRTSTEPA